MPETNQNKPTSPWYRIVTNQGQPSDIYLYGEIGFEHTADQFIDAFNNPKPKQSDFSVKLLIEDGDHGEHMWIIPTRFEDGKFVGTLSNVPDRVQSVKAGDEVVLIGAQGRARGP